MRGGRLGPQAVDIPCADGATNLGRDGRGAIAGAGPDSAPAGGWPSGRRALTPVLTSGPLKRLRLASSAPDVPATRSK